MENNKKPQSSIFKEFPLEDEFFKKGKRKNKSAGRNTNQKALQKEVLFMCFGAPEQN